MRAGTSLGTPVLLIIFNRPEPTRKLLEVLQKVKPQQLFIAADGPRKDHEGETSRCFETREQVRTMITWNCQVRWKVETQNLGCGRGPAQAIDWFFRYVEEGIILEDDCIPSISFFFYCEELLGKYREDRRITMISGTNRASTWSPEEKDYFFSLHGIAWGWATWRRAWKHYDFSMKAWENPEIRDGIREMVGPLIYFVLSREFQRTYEGYDRDQSVWDFQWHFAQLTQHGLAVVPAKNLVTNIGFGPDATHTRHIDESAFCERFEIHLPLRENPIMLPDHEYDKIATFADRYTLSRRMVRRLEHIFSKIFSFPVKKVRILQLPTEE